MIMCCFAAFVPCNCLDSWFCGKEGFFFWVKFDANFTSSHLKIENIKREALCSSIFSCCVVGSLCWVQLQLMLIDVLLASLSYDLS